MTTAEWKRVTSMLVAQGFVCQFCAKESVDTALEKQGSGKSWSDFGAQASKAVYCYSKWKRSGKWDALKGVLAELRANNEQVATKTTSAEPAPSRSLIAQGLDGWKMTEAEWPSVVQFLKARGLICERASKTSLDVALEKHGSQRTWYRPTVTRQWLSILSGTGMESGRCWLRL
jgi:hypothetical protein